MMPCVRLANYRIGIIGAETLKEKRNIALDFWKISGVEKWVDS